MKNQREGMHESVRAWTNDLERILGIKTHESRLIARIKKIKNYVESNRKEKTPVYVVPEIPTEDSLVYNAIRTLAKTIGLDEGVNAQSGMQMGHTKDLELTKEYTTLYTLMSTIRMYVQYNELDKEAKVREEKNKAKNKPNS